MMKSCRFGRHHSLKLFLPDHASSELLSLVDLCGSDFVSPNQVAGTFSHGRVNLAACFSNEGMNGFSRLRKDARHTKGRPSKRPPVLLLGLWSFGDEVQVE